MVQAIFNNLNNSKIIYNNNFNNNKKKMTQKLMIQKICKMQFKIFSKIKN